MTQPRILTTEERAWFAEHAMRGLKHADTVLALDDHVRALRAQLAAAQKKLGWYESGDVHTCHDECERPTCVKFRKLRAERDQAVRELERRMGDGIHTCSAQCRRIACVLRRERDDARAALLGLSEALTYSIEHDSAYAGNMARTALSTHAAEIEKARGEGSNG